MQVFASWLKTRLFGPLELGGPGGFGLVKWTLSGGQCGFEGSVGKDLGEWSGI